MSASLSYRPDIDGLRAVAVLGVVLYHFELGPIHGGFVGVDVFFVISGYLITSIIQREISSGQVTITGFYERRIRRIFPALFAMLLVTLIAGAILFLPSDLIRLGYAALATLFFVSNIVFWRESGYFNTASEYNPLLHTWSLAVEEQFYIGLPILLLLVHRLAPRALKPTLVTLILLSFALCSLMQAGHPSATFFLSPARAWELLLGSLLAVGFLPRLPNRAWREALAAVAFMILLGSLCLTEAGPAFPGAWAAFPVVATVALIYVGGDGDSLVRRMLEWRPLVLVGIISYSLYLWHWPMVTFARYRNGMESIPQVEAWALVLVAMAAATVSYRYVETPFRKGRIDGTRPLTGQRLFVITVSAAVVLGSASMAITLNDGWKYRFTPEVVAYDNARSPFIPFRDDCDGRAPDSRNLRCVVGDRDSNNLALVWGDSYALAWAPGLETILKAQGLRGILAVNSACPPLLGIHNPSDPSCYDDNKATHDWLSVNKPDLIIMAAAWPAYSGPDGRYSIFDNEGRDGNGAAFASAFKRTSNIASSLGKSVIIIGPTPGAPADIPFKLAIAKTPPEGTRKDDFLRMAQPFWLAARHIEALDNIVVIDTMSWFCDSRVCRYLDEQGQLLYRDGGHLSVLGADFAVTRLLSRLESGSFYQPDLPSDLE